MRALALIFISCALVCASGAAFAQAKTNAWTQLFNGRDLTGWDTWLGPRSGGYQDPAKATDPPLGLNNDPLHVFTVVEKDGQPAIRVSGELFGGLTTRAAFSNVHIRVEYKWGRKKWPPREEAKYYRDSGLLYWCVGPHGAGSSAWMRSVECNIMEKGTGQWWGVAGTYVDIEGRKVTLEKEPLVPYRGEAQGEQCVLHIPGGKQFTTGEGITPMLDPERTGEWNVCEVIAWGNSAIHILNGQVVLALANPRHKERNREITLASGRIQLQSEAAEIFFRKVEARTITGIPPELLGNVPPGAPGEEGFTNLFGKDASDGWAQCGPGNFTLENGVATGRGGMGLWWFTNRVFTNFVLRGEWKQEQPIADSGVFVRFPNPGNDPWLAVRQGHEFEIGDPAPAKITDTTGSIYPFHPPVAVPMKPYGEWNQYEIICQDHNYSFRLNGRLVNTWTDPTRRSLSGYIGLQNYNDGKTVRHRNVRIKDLPVTTVGLGISSDDDAR
ncbi:MAG TPA: DUF1080 domain-containing protein [Verrucomicrobiae bacterium]|nr:DUF1080 domain-containing protein [Verrucomicrobiae bacterium]